MPSLSNTNTIEIFDANMLIISCSSKYSVLTTVLYYHSSLTFLQLETLHTLLSGRHFSMTVSKARQNLCNGLF